MSAQAPTAPATTVGAGPANVALCTAGLAIDEHTCLEAAPTGELRLHGRGCAYRVGLGTISVLR